MLASSRILWVDTRVWNSIGSSVRIVRIGPYIRHTITSESNNGKTVMFPPVKRWTPTKTVIPIPACKTNCAMEINTLVPNSMWMDCFFRSFNALFSLENFSPSKWQDLMIRIPSKYSCSSSEAFNFASTCFLLPRSWSFRLPKIIRNDKGSVQKIDKPMRQSKIITQIQISVQEIALAIRGGTIWLMECSILAQSPIILVVSSVKSLLLNTLIGNLRTSSAIRIRESSAAV